MERIALAREYRVAEWLRNAYLELTQKTPLDFEELRPSEPYFNPLDRNLDVKKCEATIRDWETLARILYLQTKVAASILSLQVGIRHTCSKCNVQYGGYSSYGDPCLCKCRLLAMVDEAFRGELESLREIPGHVEHPLTTRKLSKYHICVR